MAIAKQFKLLNLNKKMRKFCIHEVGGVKMKKNENNNILQFDKTFFLIALFCCSLGFAFQR
jgi:hypothetical protein